MEKIKLAQRLFEMKQEQIKKRSEDLRWLKLKLLMNEKMN
jgi:hypothetical protein